MRYFCQDHPDVLTLETVVVAARPGAVALAQHPFHPGGGGQLADRGRLAWAHGETAVTGVVVDNDQAWLQLADPVELSGAVEARVDAGFRARQSALHTGAHVLNALVYQFFNGALITGAQLKDDDTARVDFDLPGVETDAVRALEAEMNAVIRRDLAVRAVDLPLAEAATDPALVRCRSVAPPPSDDGTVRVVEIVGLDRQACGGTHLASTGRSRPVRILKIDNKGRHNRRVRFGLVG
jgi:misacylated tRNA(Ala) deacylase